MPNKTSINNRNLNNNTTTKDTSKIDDDKKNEKRKKGKKKKNKLLIKFIFKIICFFGIIIGLVAFFMTSPSFEITEIEVINNEKISEDTYISLSGIKYGENIYRINKKIIIDKIKENSYVEDVKIKRELPSKIKIEVKERKATFLIKLGSSYMYIDNQGYMLEVSKDKLEVPILSGIVTNDEDIKVSNRLCEEDLEKLNKVLEIYQAASSTNIAQIISEIDITNKSNYKLVLESEKKNVYLGEADDLVNKFKWIKSTVENEKGKAGDVYADRDLNSYPVYFSPSSNKGKSKSK